MPDLQTVSEGDVETVLLPDYGLKEIKTSLENLLQCKSTNTCQDKIVESFLCPVCNGIFDCEAELEGIVAAHKAFPDADPLNEEQPHTHHIGTPTLQHHTQQWHHQHQQTQAAQAQSDTPI